MGMPKDCRREEKELGLGLKSEFINKYINKSKYLKHKKIQL